jgi:hypothetical protein
MEATSYLSDRINIHYSRADGKGFSGAAISPWRRRIAHQLSPALVPEAEAETLDAGEQSDRLDGLKERFGTMAFLGMIIGDARAYVVEVVETNVARKPLEKPGQLVAGAAPERRALIVPLPAPLPVNPFELVLDIEEPDTGRARDHNRRELKKQVRFPSEYPARGADHQRQRQVRTVNGQALALAFFAGGETFQDQA